MFYIYKDTFLSGWGLAPEGSFVISDLPLSRNEFELKTVAEKWDDIRFVNTEGKHICYWKSDGYDYLCSQDSTLSVLEIAKIPRQTWNIKLNTKLDL
nr:MAG: hypothetical protein [uncultured archaeon]